MLNKFLNFVQKSNIETTNGSDYSIVSNTIKSFGRDRFPTIDELAEQSAIAKSSVTRFIKKNGFNDYREFRTVMESGRKILYQNLELMFLKGNDSQDFSAINEAVYNTVLANLIATKNNIDMNKIMEVVKLLRQAQDVTFVGSNHDVEEFLMLQIALMTAGIPAYSFRAHQANFLHKNFITAKSVVVFVNIHDDFFDSSEILNECVEQKAQTIYLTQDDTMGQKYEFTIYYRYGVSGSLHNGYASLTYLAQLIKEFFIFSNIIAK